MLWLIYVSYLLLRRFAAGPQVQTLAAVLGIFGALDVPIVYMSNRWWRTQHPAPVFGGSEGSGMDPAMVAVLGWNMLAWFAWGVLILVLRYQVERKHQKNASQEARKRWKPRFKSTLVQNRGKSWTNAQFSITNSSSRPTPSPGLSNWATWPFWPEMARGKARCELKARHRADPMHRRNRNVWHRLTDWSHRPFDVSLCPPS